MDKKSGSVLTEHNGTRAVVGVEQGYTYLVLRLELDFRRCLERKWLLYACQHTLPWLLDASPTSFLGRCL